MNRTVLIVDDTDVCRDALELALMRMPNLLVRSVSTAEEALLCLASNDICALVTDLNLPRMDGFDLIHTIRSQPRNASLPIVVISADIDPQTPARVASLGADAYFPKPYSPAEVRNKLEELLHAS